MIWVTRARPDVDRTATPWLIRRFIDPAASVVFAPAAEIIDVAQALGGRSFAVDGADYPAGEHGCAFAALVHDFGLGDDPALVLLARLVRAATERDGDGGADDVLAPGLRAISRGALAVETDDQTLLARQAFLYDALYAWCASEVSA